MKILRGLREKRGLTLEQVADAVGLRNQYVSNYELGKRKPDYETLCNLADFFGVSVDYILGRTNDEKPASKNASGLSDYDVRVLDWFRSLPEEKRKAILDLGDGPKE